MTYFFLILTLLINYSCTGKSNSEDLYSGQEEAYQKFINPKSMPATPNLTVDKSIINEDYPIEIALYKNKKFYYNLPNLGSGKGKWEFKDGKIELKAKRALFDMYIEIYGADQELKTTAISFSDRFGAKTLRMENNNI